MEVSRRNFIGLSAATAAGLTLGEWGRRAIASLEEPRRSRNGVESWASAVCGQCPARCGIRVRLVDGRPVKIEGNPLCPLSRGKTCPKGQASLLAFYDPDRLRGPLRREGRKLQAISWDNGVSVLVRRLREARQMRFVAPLDRGPRGDILRGFCRSYGTAPPIEVGTLRDPAAALCLSLTSGIPSLPAYDIERTRYILSLGTPLLEGWSSPTWLHRAYGYFRRGRVAGRGRFVQAEARLSPTAAKADEWIPLRPGTETDFALGVAHVMIREERLDSAFLSANCWGFDDGLRELVLERYEPDAVSQRTGVPVVEIIRLAREFSSSRPALAIAEGYPFSKGLVTSWAALVLNALAGSIDAAGGVLFPESLPGRSANGITFENDADDVPAATIEEPDLLIVMGSVNAELLPRSLLESSRFVVSFSSFLDETTERADLVLPESTFLECWQGGVPEPALASPLIALAQPAVSPLLDTRDSADILLSVARELGTPLPWATLGDRLRDEARSLFEARRGSPYNTFFEGDWLRQLEHAGLWTPTYEGFEDFWQKCLGSGGWWDPGLEPGQRLRSLPTRSGKMDLFPEAIRLELRPSVVLATDGAPGKAPTGDSFPLDLLAFEILPLAALPNRNQAALYEILAPHVHQSWEPWAEIHPKTAAELGVRDREPVSLESPYGRLQVKAILYEGVMPGTVHVPLSVLQKAGGRWVPKRGSTVADLLSPERITVNRVRIVRSGG